MATHRFSNAHGAFLLGAALTLNIPSEGLNALEAQANTPESRSDAAPSLPEPPLADSVTPYATNLDVSGKWSDSFSFQFDLKQGAGSNISGSVLTTSCGKWSIRGSVSSDKNFHIRASNAAPKSGCADWFDYVLTMQSDTQASGPWKNSAGLSGSVTMTRTDPLPVNFQQVGPAVAKPNGVLHFDYKWESSTGNLADLKNCEVGEKVDYPGGRNPYDWPSPPWSNSTPNPTILWVAASSGKAQDNHSPGKFLKPYRPAKFTASQAYRYRCKTGGAKDFSGWTGISIARNVRDRTGRKCFVYAITKSGSQASIDPMPGVDPKGCTVKKLVEQMQLVSSRRRAKSQISLSVSPVSETVGQSEPIFIDVIFTNRAADDVEVDLGLNKIGNLQVTVTGPSGRPETGRSSPEGFGSSGKITLHSGESRSQRALLNAWHDFKEPGAYRVAITLMDDDAPDETRSSERPTGEFSITVGSRNPERLKSLAREFADEAVSGPTADARRTAAKSLSVMTDPAAVDGLIRVLRNGGAVAPLAVEGLAKIDSSESNAALRSARSSPDEEVRAAAQAVIGSARAGGSTRAEPAD